MNYIMSVGFTESGPLRPAWPVLFEITPANVALALGYIAGIYGAPEFRLSGIARISLVNADDPDDRVIDCVVRYAKSYAQAQEGPA